jgi:hypothetical protein
MKTATEREAAFRKDLADLLQKHNAEMDITDYGKDYGVHSPIVVITMWSEYDKDNDIQTAEFTEFTI